MTAPCHDPASEVVDAFTAAMVEAFDPASACPPVGGGSTVVRFFAGDGALPAWDPDTSREDMFLWVRLDRRYRSRSADFPTAFVADSECRNSAVFHVLAIEVGVARCTSMEDGCNWDQLAREAEISLDDSWRIEKVLSKLACRLRSKTRAVATDTIAPIGPEGGIIAWTGMAYVQF